MLKIDKTETFGWEAAIRGMRNPMNSWDKSDSFADYPWSNYPMSIGKNDLKLMKQLANAGPDHGKFLRMINVTMDITAPLYWWKEFDTYKVGTVVNSCSTMHKIHERELELKDFSWEKLDEWSLITLEAIINRINYCRNKYVETKDESWWDQMIQLLPTSYEQKRTVQLNYQVLKSIHHSRRNHKLSEWHTLCDWIETLPYFADIVL